MEFSRSYLKACLPGALIFAVIALSATFLSGLKKPGWLLVLVTETALIAVFVLAAILLLKLDVH